MSEQRITKRELLERVFGPTVAESAKEENTHARIALATARALGYTVTEEPELPERLERAHDGGVLAYASPRDWSDDPILSSPRPDVLAEAVRRYNARATVLAVADGLERRAADPILAAARLRGAYAKHGL